MAEQTLLKTAPATLWRMAWRLVGQAEAHEDHYESLEAAMAVVKQRNIAEYAELVLSPVAAELRWLTATQG
jgi:hypothetical protein